MRTIRWIVVSVVLLFVVLAVVGNSSDIVDDIRRKVGFEERVAIPEIESALSGQISSTGDIPGFRSVPVSELTVRDLKVLALALINSDRLAHGARPVVFGTNDAAQSHADDMLTGRYLGLGHWWMDGRKPYMVYSELGGDTFVAENAAMVGFLADEYDEYCSGTLHRCEEVKLVEDLKDLQAGMVYDDADSNWGHRDAIVDPNHTMVNIGIAFDNHMLVLVQHFEGDAVDVIQPPNYEDGMFVLKAVVKGSDVDVFEAVPIFREQLPRTRSVQQIGALHSYCVGGDFSEDCGNPIAWIWPPLPLGMKYLDLAENVVIADQWNVSDARIEIVADMGDFVTTPGVYTFSLLRDIGSDTDAELLAQLSYRVE